MRPFDPLTIPLRGQQLIEASAGTGKTYSIALLFLRLIIEGGFTVDEILVVTFTTSATEELCERIRTRLRDALDMLEPASFPGIEDDDLLTRLLKSQPDPERTALRLKDALARMDESAIFTIHSFCQRMLQDHAFESGSLFEAEFLESERQLRREIVRDFWRQRFYPAGGAEAAWAAAAWKNPDELAAVLEPLLNKAEIVCIPEVTAEDVERQRELCLASFRQVLDCWQESAEDIGNILQTDPCLSRNNANAYGQERLAVALDEMEEAAGRREMPWQLPPEAELFAASVMKGRLKGKKICPHHEFFELFDTFRRDHCEFLRLARIELIRSGHAFLRAELQLRKQQRGQVYFDDLLTRLDQALAGPDGHKLTQRIQGRFRIALVDEFQDTDPVQYRIFHSLFGRREDSGLFMIGDPKQSIYTFRGADVFAYIRAKKDTPAAAAFTMATNYRSSTGMVQAVNRLFDRKASFVFAEDIAFSPVQAAGHADREQLTIRGEVSRPFQAMYLGVEDTAAPNKKDIAKGIAECAASRWTAGEIAHLLALGRSGGALLGSRHLGGGDLAVLVRTHREAAMIRRDLADLGIASVYYSQDSVFATWEAMELHQLFSALLDLTHTGRVTGALATRLFGLDGHELAELQSDPAKWDTMLARLEEYRLLWRRQGVAAMLQQLFGNQQAVQRLLAYPGGERKLTNYLHIAELLQEAAEGQRGPDGLIRWFTKQCQAPDESTAAQQLRLESDENLVSITTVHKAKGLEYPVVFLPFGWSCRPVREGELYTFHRPDSLDQVVDLGSGEAEHYDRAERERLAEDLRLLYVAITRARYCCYFSWGRIAGMDKSALAWLLHGEDGQCMPDPAGLSEEKILADLNRLNQAGKMLDIIVPGREENQTPANRQEEEEGLAVRTFTGRIDTSWTISSYSGLTRNSGQQGHSEEMESGLPGSAPATAARSVFTFPRGAAAGTCLHEIFEQVDFAGYRSREAEVMVEEHLRRAGIETTWTPLVCRWVEEVLQTPLEPHSELQLRFLRGHDRLTEMGFYFAITGLDVGRLNTVLTDFGFPPMASREQEIKGLMKGYIDLVFRHRGKYYLADYKSNFLGFSPADYGRHQLAESIRMHRYDLQYLIYTVALHRHLADRIDAYDYREHFGGIYYLYLRGMHPEYPPGTGIYAFLPSRQLVEQLDACFGRETI